MTSFWKRGSAKSPARDRPPRGSAAPRIVQRPQNDLEVALSRYEHDPVGNAEILLESLASNRDHSLAQRAFAVLVSRREVRAIPLLMDAMTTDEGRRFGCLFGDHSLSAVEELLPDGAPYLRAGLADPDRDVRASVARILGKAKDAGSVEALLKALSVELEGDEDDDTLLALGYALAELECRRALPLLLEVGSRQIQRQTFGPTEHRSDAVVMYMSEETEDQSPYFVARVLSGIADPVDQDAERLRLPEDLRMKVNQWLQRLERDPEARPASLGA